MIEIKPGTLRDVTYVAVNMREHDRSECLGVLPEWVTTGMLGQMCLEHTPESLCWVATYKGNPACAFGAVMVSPLQPWRWSAWAFGTRKMRRTIPAVTRFMKETWFNDLFEAGAKRIEAHSAADHDLAHRWMAGLGAKRECICRAYGREGQDYEQWVLMKEDFD